MNHHQLNSYFPFHFCTRRRLIQRKEITNDVLKLRRRSEQPAATVWINLISDVCSGQQENPNNLDCLNPKKVWLKEMQPQSGFQLQAIVLCFEYVDSSSSVNLLISVNKQIYHVVFCWELLLHRIIHNMHFPQFLPRKHAQQALGNSGYKKKRAREEETRVRPFSLSPTTSKRLLRRLLPPRHSKHTFEFLVQFSLSLQFSSPFVFAFSQVLLYVRRTTAGIWWAQLAGDGAALGSTTAFTPILLNYTTGLKQTRCSLVQTRFFYDKT